METALPSAPREASASAKQRLSGGLGHGNGVFPATHCVIHRRCGAAHLAPMPDDAIPAALDGTLADLTGLFQRNANRRVLLFGVAVEELRIAGWLIESAASLAFAQANDALRWFSRRIGEAHARLALEAARARSIEGQGQFSADPLVCVIAAEARLAVRWVVASYTQRERSRTTDPSDALTGLTFIVQGARGSVRFDSDAVRAALTEDVAGARDRTLGSVETERRRP